MPRPLRLVLFLLAFAFAVLVGVYLGDGRGVSAMWHDFTAWVGGGGKSKLGHSPDDPALKAGLPVGDPAANLPPSPLNALLKPGLTPQQQTDVIGQMLLDYWTQVRSLPNGTWQEVCAQLAGANKSKLALIPNGHPALGKDSFSPRAGAPGIRLHVISSSGGAFQLIYDGPDGIPYTEDDQIRNFPPDLEF